MKNKVKNIMKITINCHKKLTKTLVIVTILYPKDGWCRKCFKIEAVIVAN